jgi:3-dehydroquinate dehydratase-2
MKFLVINGPNINLLGIREPEIYGREDYAELCRRVNARAAELGTEVEIFQSNHEGDIVDKIQSAYGKADGIIINPAAYTHTSVAIRDALAAVDIPAVEVHISDVNSREGFRKLNYISEVCLGSVNGRGIKGYTEAMDMLFAELNGGKTL